ncbi:MAG: hypothetical protein K2M20_12695 [Lachnospiraceae bacterium]|nr:hypothetical protein [Lachnospiraceae bacterium]
MMDQYKEQYKKETEQIHAPVELIARTKAAMREEEARIRREFAVQAAGPEMAETLVMPRERSRGMNARKWAYPLTAAAALFILVSVSMMMRGLKSGKMASDNGAYEEMAVEMETAEMSGGEDLDGGMAVAGAAADSAEGAETAFADEVTSAETEMAASPACADEIGDLSGPTAEGAVSDRAALSKGAGDASAEKLEAEEAERNEQQGKRSDAEKSLADDGSAAPAENGVQSGAADTENITIERVIRKPDFCGRPDTEMHVYEGETFHTAKEGDGWAAYVESGDGDQYVIRGEAENLETFLEAGYRKLLEMK